MSVLSDDVGVCSIQFWSRCVFFRLPRESVAGPLWEPRAIVGCSPWLAATVKLPNHCAIPKECLVPDLARKACRNCSICILVLLFIRIVDTNPSHVVPSPHHFMTTSSQYQLITTTYCKFTSLKTSNFRCCLKIQLYSWKFPLALCGVYLYP